MNESGELNKTDINTTIINSELYNAGDDYIVMIMTHFYLYGGSINVAILIPTVAVLSCCKSVWSYRNTIHINLLASFLLRFTTELIFVGSLYAGYIIEELGMKIIYYIFNYVCLATFMWMLVEGLYLHFILVLRPFQDSKPPFLLFYFIGWGIPGLTLITWSLCLHFSKLSPLDYNAETVKIAYIITVPIILCLVINFIIVINLIRIILTKLTSKNNTEARKLWQVSKSMMILIFLLGPIHLVFAFPMYSDHNPTLHHVYMVYNIVAPHVQSIICAIFSLSSGKVPQTFTRRWSRFKDLQAIQNITSQKRKRSSNTTVSSVRAFSKFFKK
ncbi:corticotropin-releasing factor receptor 2-like isoform X2 [Physella acuta]|uniref:corticotropin-releasing factor receptor 2-like isoform X2 n=1 Tax=Physella acuta TaxID=109671 RepID=UPI0027DC3987|nr:corticotropin-releasing factor receptor 2-like isoform X2 [Physella acuta]